MRPLTAAEAEECARQLNRASPAGPWHIAGCRPEHGPGSGHTCVAVRDSDGGKVSILELHRFAVEARRLLPALLAAVDEYRREASEAVEVAGFAPGTPLRDAVTRRITDAEIAKGERNETDEAPRAVGDCARAADFREEAINAVAAARNVLASSVRAALGRHSDGVVAHAVAVTASTLVDAYRRGVEEAARTGKGDAEIAARDTQTAAVTGTVKIIRGNLVALVYADPDQPSEIAPVRLSLEAFPDIPDGARVEVTVRVLEETK